MIADKAPCRYMLKNCHDAWMYSSLQGYPGMATMLAKVLQIERHQVADYARVDYAITKAEDEIAALEELWLRPNELRRENLGGS
jgi:hypothetical protein